MLMDCMMLPPSQLTLSHCTQSWALSVITKQQASVDIESILLHRLTAIVLGEAQRSLV